LICMITDPASKAPKPMALGCINIGNWILMSKPMAN